MLEESPFLGELLWEAVAQLDCSFGPGSIKKVEVIRSDEGLSIGVIIRNCADGPNDAEDALREADEKWWLLNCHRSDGSLVFDYEIGHGV